MVDSRNASFIYLASGSPRRQELLRQIGVPYELLVADTDGPDAEDAEAIEAEQAAEEPSAYVQRVTQAKLDAAVARLLRRRLPLAPVLCADTTVALETSILGKPRNAAHACEMLGRLAGKRHTVYTAVAVAMLEDRESLGRAAALSRSEVTFAPLGQAEIERYVATGEPFGKAGSYGIQGEAARFIERISGSYSGIMGLPLFETAQLLRAAGFFQIGQRAASPSTSIRSS